MQVVNIMELASERFQKDIQNSWNRVSRYFLSPDNVNDARSLFISLFFNDFDCTNEYYDDTVASDSLDEDDVVETIDKAINECFSPNLYESTKEICNLIDEDDYGNFLDWLQNSDEGKQLLTKLSENDVFPELCFFVGYTFYLYSVVLLDDLKEDYEDECEGKLIEFIESQAKERISNNIIDDDIVDFLNSRKVCITLLEISARFHNPLAQYLIGDILVVGTILQDIPKALSYLELASDNGYDLAQYELANFLLVGLKGEPDFKRIIELLDKSSASGNILAKLQLGGFYFNGIGVPKNMKLAFDFLIQCAEFGIPDAQSLIATMYKEGLGIEQDTGKYRSWMQRFVEDNADDRAKALSKVYKSSYFNPSFPEEILSGIKELDLSSLSTVMQSQRTEVFISYSHKDEAYLNEILPFLSLLERSGITIWCDKYIEPGCEWDVEIRNHLELAKVAVLLVSQDFIDSKYIWENELNRLLNEVKEQGVKILWLPVSPSTVMYEDINKYQCVCDPKATLSRMSEDGRKDVYVSLNSCIRKIYELSESVISP